MNQPLGQSPRSDLGPIEMYLGDIAKLPPEVTRPEQMNFRIQINRTTTPATIVATTPSRRIEPEYVFALRRIKAFVSNPVVNGIDVDLAEFQIRDQGRARGGIFDSRVNMAVLCGPSGPAHDMVFDSFYAFVPGADVIVDWSLDLAALGNVQESARVVYGVSITGDLVRVRNLPDGTIMIPGLTDQGSYQQRR